MDYKGIKEYLKQDSVILYGQDCCIPEDFPDTAVLFLLFIPKYLRKDG